MIKVAVENGCNQDVGNYFARFDEKEIASLAVHVIFLLSLIPRCSCVAAD